MILAEPQAILANISTRSKITFVIPSYNNTVLLKQILSDVTRCTYDEIILLDDASPDEEMRNKLEEYKLCVPDLTVVYNDENLYFLRSSNLGLRMADDGVVILLSTDVHLTADLGAEVCEILSKTPNALIGGRYLVHDTGWNTFDGEIFPYLEGWLLAANKSTWEELGYFDERYAPNDYEDVDLSTTAQDLEIPIIALNSPHYWHTGGQTIGYSPKREAITRRNRELFREKWLK